MGLGRREKINKEIINSEEVINKKVTGEMRMEMRPVNIEEKVSEKVSKGAKGS